MVLAGILQEHLTLKCTFSESCYCEFTGTYRELQNHLRICEFKNGTINYQSECAKKIRSRKRIAGRPKMRPDEKIPLQDCKVSYVKTARHLTKITEATDEAIEHFSENKTDCKYFMLIEQLKNTNRTAEAQAIDNIWRHGIQKLAADECLTLKVKLLMSDDQYVTEYKWLNEHNYPILKPLNQLKKIEHKYLPGFVEFQILSEDGQQLLENYKLPETEDPKPFCKPVDLTEDNLDFLSMHYPKPLVAGSRYPISLAIAKILEESAEEFMQDLHELYDKVMCDNEDISGQMSLIMLCNNWMI